MSGIAHAVKSVFKGVVGFVKKYWKPILAAVAIYFTAGAAAAYFAGAGGAGAFAGATATAAGSSAAAAGEVGATLAATGAGEAAAAGGLAAGADTAAAIGSGAADASAIGAAYTGGAAADAAGAGVLADAGAGAAAGGAADFAGNGMLTSYGADAAGGTADVAGTAGQTALDGSQLPGMNYTPGGADPGAGPSEPSSWWDSAKSFASNHSDALLNAGTRMLSGYMQGQQQQDMMDAQMKWAEAHAPGHVTGGVGDPFAGWKNNQNLSVTPQGGPYGKTPLAGGINPAAQADVPQVPTQTYPQLNVGGGGGLMGGGGIGGAEYNPNYGGPVHPWYPTGGPGGLMQMPYMDNPEGEA